MVGGRQAISDMALSVAGSAIGRAAAPLLAYYHGVWYLATRRVSATSLAGTAATPGRSAR